MGKERRQNERINSLVSVAYSSKDGALKGYSLTKDISTGGLCLASEKNIPRGTKLDLDIIIDQRDQWIMPVKARVAWSRQNPEHWKSPYSYGLEFLKIDLENKNQLFRFAKRHKWEKNDFETALEDNKVQILGKRGEY